MYQRRLLILGIGIFVLLVVSLQIFLLMVGLEAWLTYERGIAWGAAITSVLLAAFVVLLYRFLMQGPRRMRATARPLRPTSRPSRPTERPDRRARPSGPTPQQQPPA
jgi:membrane protein implicated in regulation of membrane protease activity